MKKILYIPLLLITICMSAAPIGEKKAREIAESFFSSSSTRAIGQTLELEYVADFSGEDQLYVFNRVGGGFAIVAGDDRFTPIIACSHEHSFDAGNIPDAARHLLDCWAEQIAKGATPALLSSDTESIGNPVLKYDTPLWDQGEPYNREAPVIGGKRCVTGCVATAMSMIMYWNRWPDKGSGTVPSYSYQLPSPYGTQTIPSYTLGRRYDYDNMLSDYYYGYNDTQADAVAALMKDTGIAVEMTYSPTESGAGSTIIPIALSKYFRYSKSAFLAMSGTYGDKGWIEALQRNLTEAGPTIITGQSEAGGHAFIADGYTDRGYISLNFGWGGYSNGWYLMPSIEYNETQMAVFGATPDRNNASSYCDILAIYPYNDGVNQYTGLKALDTDFTPGATCRIQLAYIANMGQVTFNGHFKLSVYSRSGEFRYNLISDIPITGLQPSYMFGYSEVSVNLPPEISEGDRIRFMYKGEYSDDWQWARKAENTASDEIILRPSPEEIAESIRLSYSKTDKKLTFTSQYNIEWVFTDSSSSTISSGKTNAREQTSIDVSGIHAGSYVLSVSSGGRPYEVTLTF